jgi:hypothetical protein
MRLQIIKKKKKPAFSLAMRLKTKNKPDPLIKNQENVKPFRASTARDLL